MTPYTTTKALGKIMPDSKAIVTPIKRGYILKSTMSGAEYIEVSGIYLKKESIGYLILRTTIESSIHNDVMHDCNRHRENGYKDQTYLSRIPDEFVDEFAARRNADLNRN